MADLIDRQAAIDIVRKYEEAHIKSKGYPMLGGACICTELKDIPSADVQPVVRCRDCKYRDEMGRCEMWECYQMPDMGFCHEGVRKDG